jgi:uncharacterized protein (TIGR02145 family)
MRLHRKYLTFSILIYAAVCTFSYSQETGSFTDNRDRHEYSTVKIGDQWWMSENLAYQTSNGCLVYEGVEKYLETYGYLYTWETALQACPDGWHLPSDAEFEKLSRYLGGEGEAGGKLKEAGTKHWDQPNTGATNSSGFSALAAGYEGSEPYQYFIGKRAYFWSYDETVADSEIARALYFNNGEFTRYGITRENGLSVRCIKDQ